MKTTINAKGNALYLRDVPSEVKASFKAECARRKITFLKAFAEFIRQSRTILPLLVKGIEEHRHQSTKDTMTQILLKPMPPWQELKAWCAFHDVTMTEAFNQFMRQGREILPLLRIKGRTK